MASKSIKRVFALLVTSVFASGALAGCLGGDDGDSTSNGTDDTTNLAMKMGTMTPLTGPLNNLGPGMQNGAKLAIRDVNNANLGITIEAFHDDDTTVDTAKAGAALDLLISKGVTAVAGPCCSGITGAILDKAIENEVVIASPSATSPALTERDNKGYFWRVAPTDEGQGRVLAALVAGDGIKSANLIIVNNDYGNGLANIFTEEFQTSLSGVVGTTSKYDEGATDFSSQVTEACTTADAVEAVVFVAYTDDVSAILKSMQAQGCLSKVKLYSSEGVYSPDAAVVTKAGKDADGNFLAAGMKGTTPQAPGARFSDLFKAAYGGEEPVQYAAESYDAVAYVALAALHAKSVKGADISKSLLTIANAPGTECNTFESCAKLVNAGTDINYVGFAHDLMFTEKHEPASGAYSYWEVTPEGEMSITQENVVAG